MAGSINLGGPKMAADEDEPAGSLRYPVKMNDVTEFERLVYSVLQHYGDKELVRILKTFINMPGDERKLDFVLRLLRAWNVPIVGAKKDKERSENLRKMGNYLAGIGNYKEALPLYNQSLQFAPPTDVEILKVTFFNRAITLFFLGHYLESIIDLGRVDELDDQGIKEADVLFWKAKNYWKLGNVNKAKRKAERALGIISRAGDHKRFKKLETMIKKIDVDIQIKEAEQKVEEKKLRDDLARLDVSQSIASLSGPEDDPTEKRKGRCDFSLPSRHPTMPEFSAALKVEVDETLGRHVLANEDLKPGDVVCVEEPYATILASPFWRSHCFQCFKRTIAPVPCSTCTQVIYCNDYCYYAGMPTHKLECPFIGNVASPQLGNHGYLPFRVLLMPGVMEEIRSKWGTELYDDVIEKALTDPNPEARAAAQKQLQSYLPDGKAPPYLRMCSLVKHEDGWEPRSMLWLAMLASYYIKLLEKADFFKEDGNNKGKENLQGESNGDQAAAGVEDDEVLLEGEDEVLQ